MLYDTTFISKEFRSVYTQQGFSRNRQFSMGIFLGLLTFAVYFSLQTLKESVINDVAPYLLLPSYFSTLYIYLLVSLVFNIVLFIVNYEYMTLIEVMQNRWYALVQLGYSPAKLIGGKIVARILAQAGIYTVGYIATIFLSSFLKFPLVLDYIGTMYIMGLVDIVLLAVVSLAVSLFLKDVFNARYVVGMLALGIIGFKLLTRYFTILTDRTLMNNLENFFDITQTVYMFVAAGIIAGSIAVCLARGTRLAKVYNPPLLKTLPTLTNKPEGTVVLGSPSDGRKRSRILEAQATPVQRKKPWNLAAVITSILVIASITGMLLLNIVVLAFGYASPEKETSIYGIIPYVFQSYTMEPEIMYNDVAFFRKVDAQAELKVGDVLLFKDAAGGVNVGSLIEFVTDDVTGKQTGALKTDITNYMDERYKGMAEQTVNRDQVYGVHVDNNRWFGAVILFANTILGRLVLLLIPTFLIFFYEPIVDFFRSITKEKD